MQKFAPFLDYHSRVLPVAPLSFLRWLLCPLVVLVACESPEPDDRPLAQVGTELITERDYRSFVAGLPEWTKSAAEGSDQVRDYLQSLVDRALILHTAREQKVEQSAGVQKNMEVALRLKVGQAMEQRYIRPAVSVSEEELRREFAAQDWERQLKIAHIFTRTQARAEAALAALQAGRAFAEVAHEFSQNRTSAAHGGEKPYYYSRINAIPAVRDSLFSLPKGAISAILPVPKGYEIFKILDERIASYEQMRPQVLKAVMRERLQARRRAYIDSLAEQFQWQEVAESMDRLTRILHSGAQEDDKKVFYLSEADAAAALYTYRGGAISLGEAVNRSQFIRQGRYVEDSLKVASYLERDVKVPHLLLLQGRALGINQEPAIADWLARKKEEILIREMRRLATADQKPVTEQEMRAHYEAHPRSYQTSSMVEVVEIQVEEEVQARELLSQIRADRQRATPLIALLAEIIKNGREVSTLQNLNDELAVYGWLKQRLSDPLGAAQVAEEIANATGPADLAETYIARQLATVHSVRHGSREVAGLYQLYWHETTSFGPLVKGAMEAEIGALIGPVEHHGLYSIAKIAGRAAAGRQPFAEVQKRIGHTLRRNRENELFGQWLQALRADAANEVIFFDDNIEALGQDAP
ncbi:MAG: peptidyl-prolyl cis-trans isomerase [Gemmatimonadetes bacterium]|nr:peptidyl-prolyl cis-trans isomerase [Gemmatimonadota bacterium]